MAHWSRYLRFDRLLYLSVAETHDAQLNILQALTRKFKLDNDVGDLRVIAEQCPFNLTGADFYALCSDAMLKAMSRKASEVDSEIGGYLSCRQSGAYRPLTRVDIHSSNQCGTPSSRHPLSGDASVVPCRHREGTRHRRQSEQSRFRKRTQRPCAFSQRARDGSLSRGTQQIRVTSAGSGPMKALPTSQASVVLDPMCTFDPRDS